MVHLSPRTWSKEMERWWPPCSTQRRSPGPEPEKPERCREMWGDDEKWITRWPEMCRQQLQQLVGAGRNWQQVASTEPIDAY